MVDDPQSANSGSPHSTSGATSSEGATPNRFTGGAARSSGGREASESSRTPFDDALGQGAMALDVAKFWIRQNQTASMIGAFALGVFTGAMLRD